jgi:predicted nucleic acid-binding OB-fold protein
LFSYLHAGPIETFRLHFGEIILLPKLNEVERLQQYRHICLLNVSFNNFTNVATIRLNSVIDHVVRPSETAFMQGRNILDGAVALHETVYKLNTKKLSGIVLN